MVFTGKCLMLAQVDVSDLIRDTPEGKVPMFEIIAGHDDQDLGSCVYLKEGVIYSVITDQRVKGIKATSLRFCRYIKTP